jgi:outer membrane lipoprotein carrier protein
MLGTMRVVCLLVLGLVPAHLGAQAPPTPDAIARALQTRYQTIRDFSADFSQTYRGGALRTQTREEGTVAVKKPGRMRWIYTKPDRKEFVSDGSKIYTYLPADKQVIEGRVPADDQATTPALFLTGKGDLSRDFTASFAPTPLAGTIALKLVPRRADPDFEYFVIVLDPGTLQIRALSTRDRQGGESTLTFTQLKENRGIADKEFVFRIPRGVDVVSNDDSQN